MTERITVLSVKAFCAKCMTLTHLRQIGKASNEVAVFRCELCSHEQSMRVSSATALNDVDVILRRANH